MKQEIPTPFIPRFRNYAQEIVNRLDGQDEVLRELAGLAKEMALLLGEQQRQIAALQQSIEALLSRP